MKQFKNNNFVVHSNSIPLLNAFYQLALEMGRKDDVLWNKSRRANYTYLWFSDDFDMQFHNHNCSDATKELYNLPQDWDKALALASEVVEPEVIKTKTPLELLIEEAEKRYPKGTKFTPAHVKQRDTVYTSTGKVSSNRSTISHIMVKIVENEGWSPVVYFNNKWAEIIKDTPKPVIYKRGDRFIREGREYILARESANYRSLILVCLDDGNIWSDAVRVDDPEKVTEAEFKKLCSSGKFKLVKK